MRTERLLTDETCYEFLNYDCPGGLFPVLGLFHRTNHQNANHLHIYLTDFLRLQQTLLPQVYMSWWNVLHIEVIY